MSPGPGSGPLPVIGDLLIWRERLEVYCQNPGCDRPHIELTPKEAVAMLGPKTTFREAGRAFQCSVCGERGHEGRIHCRSSMSDYYHWLEVEKANKNPQYPRPAPLPWMAEQEDVPGMCNDFRLMAGLDYLIETFSQVRMKVRFPKDRPNFPPRADVRITDTSPIVRGGADGGGDLEMMRWSWPGPRGAPVFNFRSEGRRFGQGRCLVLADGFYEFTGAKSPKSKWLFTMPAAPVFAIAGYVREGAAKGEDAWTMLTCEPGPDIAPYHDRQVVLLQPPQWAGWLSHAENEAELLRPAPAGSLKVEKVA